jgi:hypothetical protein
LNLLRIINELLLIISCIQFKSQQCKGKGLQTTFEENFNDYEMMLLCVKKCFDILNEL